MGNLAKRIAERVGHSLAIIKFIRNLMKNMRLTAQQAMDVLEILVAEQSKYAALL